MTVLLLLFFAVVYSSNSFKRKAVYSCKGKIQLPYSNIVEPFTIKYDSKTNSSLITYYGISKYLSSQNYGSVSVIPGSSNGLQEMECLQGGAFQSVFPDLKSFSKLPGTYACKSEDGVLNKTGNCFVWRKIEDALGRNNTYLFFTDNRLIPARYEMFGFDSLFGSHYDKYMIDYFDYEDYPDNTVDREIEEIMDQFCRYQKNDQVEEDMHIDLISEFFDQERARKVHKMHFEASVSKHSFTAGSDRELQEAENNHVHSLRFVMSHSRRDFSFKLELNFKSFESWDPSKRSQPCLLQNRPDHEKNPLFEGYTGYAGIKLPNEWDWRAYGAVSPVKDQAICGSCWSFGTTGVIESHYFIKTNKSVLFSEQQLVDCSWGQSNNGCFGGLDVNSYAYIKSYGLASTDQYGPYMGMDRICKEGDFAKYFNLRGYKKVPNDVTAIMNALYTVGPLSIAIDASRKSFGFYKSGVYDDPTCSSTDLDHAVLLVGYKLTGDNTGYWIVKNSWSTNWGDDGFVKISMNGNRCGVGSEVTYPLFN